MPLSPYQRIAINGIKGVDAIEKDRSREGYVIVRYSEITDADFVVLSKSVKIIK